MNEIYLVRHGLIDVKTLLLNNDGIKFASELNSILKDKQINFIASSSETRCINTVVQIASERKLKIKTYDKVDFLSLKPLQDAKLHSYSNTLLCYRIEEINPILEALGQTKFNGETRDSGYEQIIHLTIHENGKVNRNQDIATGCKKNK